MSKSNVNPNHYKVAGRERQGEDIAQARNKQKHAESLVRQRSDVDARFQKPAPERGPAPSGPALAESTRKATPKAIAKTVPARPKPKRAQGPVPGKSGSNRRLPKSASVPVPRPGGGRRS